MNQTKEVEYVLSNWKANLCGRVYEQVDGNEDYKIGWK